MSVVLVLLPSVIPVRQSVLLARGPETGWSDFSACITCWERLEQSLRKFHLLFPQTTVRLPVLARPLWSVAFPLRLPERLVVVPTHPSLWPLLLPRLPVVRVRGHHVVRHRRLVLFRLLRSLLRSSFDEWGFPPALQQLRPL